MDFWALIWQIILLCLFSLYVDIATNKNPNANKLSWVIN